MKFLLDVDKLKLLCKLEYVKSLSTFWYFWEWSWRKVKNSLDFSSHPLKKGAWAALLTLVLHECPSMASVARHAEQHNLSPQLSKMQEAALICPGARHRQFYVSSATWAKILLSVEAAATTGERHLFSYSENMFDFASSFSSHCWKVIMKEEHYLLHINVIHDVIVFTFCQASKYEL